MRIPSSSPAPGSAKSLAPGSMMESSPRSTMARLGSPVRVPSTPLRFDEDDVDVNVERSQFEVQQQLQEEQEEQEEKQQQQVTPANLEMAATRDETVLNMGIPVGVPVPAALNDELEPWNSFAMTSPGPQVNTDTEVNVIMKKEDDREELTTPSKKMPAGVAAEELSLVADKVEGEFFLPHVAFMTLTSLLTFFSFSYSYDF
jgi:hypothetical protein